METTSISANEIRHEWFIINAEGQTLGRLASNIAQILRGKNKEYFGWASYISVTSPVARNGCAQRVYHVDGTEKNVQPIEKRFIRL